MISCLCRLRSSRQDGDVVDDNDGEDMNIKMLRMSVPGEPGVVRILCAGLTFYFGRATRSYHRFQRPRSPAWEKRRVDIMQMWRLVVRLVHPMKFKMKRTSLTIKASYHSLDQCLACITVIYKKVVHTCGGGSRVVNRFSFIKYSTLCSNGTIYSQEMGVSCCRHWADCISFVVILIADLPLVVPGWLWKLWKVLFQPGLFNPHQNTKCLFHSHRNTQCSVCIHPEQHPGWLPIFGSILFLI